MNSLSELFILKCNSIRSGTSLHRGTPAGLRGDPPSGQAGRGRSALPRGLSRSEPCTQQQTPQSALGLFPHKGAHASQSPAGTDKGSGEAAPPRCFFAASSPRRRPRGWGGNAPPRFSDRASAREHLRACGAAQQHHQALKRFRRIGNRSAGGTADYMYSCLECRNQPPLSVVRCDTNGS
eukprot:COSAG02_NODE_42_length_46522_cov_109.704478_10_plen_180_part_00